MHGLYIASILKNHIIFEAHTPIFEQKNHRLFFFKKLIQSKYFLKMVVISNALKKMYLDNGYLNDTKIKVAHDAADKVENFKKSAQLQGNNKNLKVGYIGHLYKGKGMEIISSMAQNLDEDVEIHIIGGTEKNINFWRNRINHKIFFLWFYFS